uniref:uncharacterized protein LOC120344277 isoform X1 n=1 Tax=Styela clava TaxID=7725 RepID=UPI001939EF13|nr:uncharacterized protein LOC120344277 isoform X1 [Styela clava]
MQNYGLALCLFLILLVCWSKVVDGKHIECRRKKSENSKYLNKRKCYCYNVTGPGWSKKEVKPAPAVYNLSLVQSAYNISKGETRIGVDITWTQKSSDIEYIDPGYFIEVVDRSSNEDWQYKCLIKVNNSKTEMVTFRYTFKTIQHRDEIVPGKTFYIKIFGLPMYNKDDTPSSVKGEIKIKKCGNTQSCIHDKKKKTNKKNKRIKGSNLRPKEENNVKNKNKDNVPFEHTILVAVFATVAVISVIAIIVYKTSQREREKLPKEVRHILVIGDYIERYTPVVNRLIEIFREDNVEIHSNIRQVSEVGQNGIITWTTEALEKVDVAIFVVNSLSQLRNEDVTVIKQNGKDQYSPVKIAIRIAENIALKKGFKNSRKKFIVVDLNQCIVENPLIMCEVYNLEKDFKRMLKHALGPNYKDENIKQKKETLAKLISASRKPRSTRPKERSLQPVIDFEKSNNLDESIPHECEQIPLNSLNIQQDQPQSVECNVCR